MTNRAQTAAVRLAPLIISAPFGNYIQPAGTTPTLGTFTAAARPGRLLQVVRTVRYYPHLQAWINQIGLRNPGIDSLVQRVESAQIVVSDKIVSIHGFCSNDWWKLLDIIARIKPLAVELNMSCPNVGEVNWPQELFSRALATGIHTIVKLPPVNYQALFEQSHDAGIRTFHCCNTLPVPAGGLSGAPLKPIALQCIRNLLASLDESGKREMVIIGGGGVRITADVDEYADAGASHVAVGTRALNPIRLFTDGPLRPLIERAQARFQTTAA